MRIYIPMWDVPEPGYEPLRRNPVRWFLSRLAFHALVAVIIAVTIIAGVAVYAWLT